MFRGYSCYRMEKPRLCLLSKGFFIGIPAPNTACTPSPLRSAGRTAGRRGCQAPMRFGWAIQSSWTNGARWRLTRPIRGFEKLVSGFGLILRSSRVHAPPRRRYPRRGLTQTVGWQESSISLFRMKSRHEKSRNRSNHNSHDLIWSLFATAVAF